MGKLEEIKEKLQAGSTTKQLVEQGYSKSSIFHVARKLKDIQSGIPASSVPDDLQELRHQRDIIKLQKEIAELEATKERLPERVAKLEAEVQQLNQQLPELLAYCFAGLYVVILTQHGWNPDEAVEEAKVIGKDFIEHLWPQH